MEQLVRAIPDVDVLLELEPEELAAKLLFLVRQAHRDELFHPQGLGGRLWEHHVPEAQQYPRAQMHAVRQALTEAWAWLEAQGLIVPAEGINGQNGYRVLSRRARRFENEQEFANYTSARHLPRREVLHPRIGGLAWSAFMRGEFDAAAFQAMKAVEAAVREAADLDAGDIGTGLMRKAFHVDTGPLTDMQAEKSERQARSDLFCGAIGSYKNPHSHRDVNLEDPLEAAEIVMLANHLLQIVDARKAENR